MTNKEAIKYLQQLYTNGGHCWLDEQRIEAIGMAVKALQEEPVSEELEEAAEDAMQTEIDTESPYTDGEGMSLYPPEYLKSLFIEGANWQKQQLMAKAFDFTKEHNTACVLASECLRNHGWFNREGDFNDLFRHLSCVDELFVGKFSGKTKVIVIKED